MGKAFNCDCEDFVGAVSGKDAIDRAAVHFGNARANGYGNGIGITAKTVNGELCYRLIDLGRGWIRVFVGVKLYDVGKFRLLARCVALHGVDIVGYKFVHLGLP